MLSVLIAEDEENVRLDIENSVNRGKLEMQVVASVENGRTAWEEIQRCSPNIVIADVCMPEMDGLRFAEDISVMHDNTYIIVIVCLEDSDLVKKLLALGVKDYLVKPTLTKDGISECLKRAYDYFKLTNSNAGKMDLRMDKKVRCDKAMLNFLQNSASEQETADILEDGGVFLSQKQLVFAYGKVDVTFDCEQNQIEVPIKQIHGHILDLIRSELYSGYELYTFSLDNDYFILILCYPLASATDDVKSVAIRTLRRMYTDIVDNINVLLSFSIGYGGQDLGQLRESFLKCKESLTHHYIACDGTIICDWSDEDKPLINEQCSILEGATGWIKRAIGDDAYEPCVQLINELRINTTKSRGAMISSLMKIPQYIAALFSLQNNDEIAKCDEIIKDSKSLSFCVATIVSFIQSSEQQYLQRKLPGIRKEIKQAVDFVDNNFTDPDLTLGLAAKQVGLNETYFSTIFKQEMQQSFVQYLTLKRLEMAKKLLKETHLKMIEISERIGFTDVTYFSKVFKKGVGIAPSEWRRDCNRNVSTPVNSSILEEKKEE